MRIAQRAAAFAAAFSMLAAQAPLPAFTGKSAIRALPPSAMARAERLIDPAEGGLVELDGVSVELPAGALREPTLISIERLPSVEDTGEGISNVTSGSPGYRFGPRGIHFEKPVRVRVGFDPAILESEVALSNLYTYFYNESSGLWERLTRVGIDRLAAVVTSETRHFTDMINGTLKLPEGPKGPQFDVNSIKKLEAANPASAVSMPEGPEPNAFGSNSFSIPLRLPPGRGGASPRLALRYSSDSSNGWLGRGFDIDVPAITIDTRFGLPEYEGRDLYSLGGEELVPVPSDAPGRERYRPRAEKAFQQIYWIRSDGEDYWEVADKDGTVREYGRGEGWIGPERDTGDRSRTYAWYLEKERDRFGNTVDYRYDYDAANRRVYLREIRYSGYEKGGRVEPGLYSVLFDSEEREDRRIDARGLFPEKTAKRLARIDVRFGPEGASTTLRGYLLDYGEYNEFGQSQLRKLTETDGAGRPFYSYEFDYIALDRREGGAGDEYDEYEGFGALMEGRGYQAETWSLEAPPEYGGFSSSISSSLSGSLSASLELFAPKLFGKRRVAHIEAHGGLGFSIGAGRSSFVDIDGDGLSDIVWRDGGSLEALFNEGSNSFRSGPSLPNFSAAIDKESSSFWSYGASAGIAGLAGAGITAQESKTKAETSFADVNGDGLIDFVKEDSGGFDLNIGGASFIPSSWTFGAYHSPAPSPEDAAEDEKRRRQYYLEEPVRAWEAWRAGSVSVSQSASMLDAGLRTGQIVLETHAPNGQTDEDSWIVLPGPGHAERASYELNPRDRLFFRQNTLGDERNAGVDWNIVIKYAEIEPFEDLKVSTRFAPPAALAADGIGGLERLYDTEPFTGQRTLRGNWKDLAELPEYEELAARGFFVADKVPGEVFRRMLEAAPDEAGDEAAVTDRRLLWIGYRYEPETDCFVRAAYSNSSDDEVDAFLRSALRRSSIDQAFRTYVMADGITNEDRRAIALAKAVDRDGYVLTRQAGDSRSYVRAAPESIFNAAILPFAAGGEAVDGQLAESRGILLDTRLDPASGAIERLWLAGEEEPRILRESGGLMSELERSGLSVERSPDTLIARFEDRGIAREFSLAGKTSLIRELPESVYAGIVGEHVLAGMDFLADSFSALSGDNYEAIASVLSDERPEEELFSDLELFESSYEPVGGGAGFVLRPGLDESALERLVGLIDEAAIEFEGPFARLPGDPEGRCRFISMSNAEYSAFIDSQGSELEAFFESAGSSRRYLDPYLGDEERESLESEMRLYYRDGIAFPYYDADIDRGLRVLKPDLSANDRSRVAELLSACGLSAYTRLTKSIEYRSDARLPVSDAELPEGAHTENIAPSGGEADQAGDEVGLYWIVALDDEGNTRLLPRYLRVYDSSRDYSATDLTASSDAAEAPIAARTAYFSGGVQGWYYGMWTGFYDWDSSLLGKAPEDAYGESGGEVDVATPYYTDAMPNGLSDGALRISKCGKETIVPVSRDAWVGDVTSYTASTINDDCSFATTSFSFAAFIDGDRLRPGRYGGDTFRRLEESGSDGASGGRLPFVRKSRSSSVDMSASALGASFGRNESSSWQYAGLQDMNGDRFPDLVRFDDSKDGASSFLVTPGSGGGFGSTETYALGRAGWLGMSETKAWSFGGSLLGSAGGIQMIFSPMGEASAAKAQSAGDSQPGIDASINGSFGSSCQTALFSDLNGDGLPDFVARSGEGAFGVALSRGDGSYGPETAWGSGIEMDAFEGIAGGIGEIPLQGVSHTAVSSIGGNLSVSFSVGGVGIGASFGLSGNSNSTLSSLADVNGDGLPDLVAKKEGESFFRVRFNRGDRFSDREARIYRPEWPQEVEEYSNNVAKDLRALSAGQGGIEIMGADITGRMPGLGGLNLDGARNDFSDSVNPLRIHDYLEYSTSASFNLGANASVGFDVWLLVLKLSAGINGSVATTSADLKFADIDGDGLPDHIFMLPGGTCAYVKRNRMGTAGLLKAMRLPQGGSYEFSYDRVGNTKDMPQSRYVLSSLVKDDGVAELAPDRGAHRYVQSFSYEGGKQDRVERMFYGFGKVSVRSADGSVSTTVYRNDDYCMRGIAVSIEDAGPEAEGRIFLYRKTDSQYVPREIAGSLNGRAIKFPALLSQWTTRHEPGSSTSVVSGSSYDRYDEYGNVEVFTDRGRQGDDSDDLVATISYDDGLPGYLRQFPTSVEVRGRGGKLMRRRLGDYGSSGELVSFDEYYGANLADYRRYALSYDEYGNLASITDPRGFTSSWSYDSTVHAYPVGFSRGNSRIPGTPTYRSSAEWNYALGQKASETDENGRTMSYGYDDFGRLAEVRSPYDTGPTPALRCAYSLGSIPWTATTWNKLLYDPEDEGTIRTIVAVDGLGRVLQSAKDGERRDSDGGRRYGWNLSGAVAYDEKGRAAMRGQPRFYETARNDDKDVVIQPGIAPMHKPTLTGYDAIDRIIATELPDGSRSTSSYSIFGGRPVETSIDPKLNAMEKTLDERGSILSIRRLSSSGQPLISASYEYNELGEILAVVDSRGNKTVSTYDLSGARTSLTSPDAGKIILKYGDAGDLVEKTDEVLRSRGEAIRYEYDGLGRLVKVNYPRMKPTVYVYGGESAPHLSIGRLARREDASGTTGYEYGLLGETLATTRIIDRLTPLAADESARFEYRSDYLGRIQRITYPDGEILSYGYDWGGRVASIRSSHQGLETDYAEDIAYDEFGHPYPSFTQNLCRVRQRYAHELRVRPGPPLALAHPDDR